MPNSSHELLPLVIQENNVLVDATLLHRKLKVKTKFADWIKSRIKRYGFEINKDYFSEVSEKLGVGRKAVNFFLSLDMAKELAMLEENETGRSIRRYFIAKEKELRGISHLPREQAFFKGMKAKRINDRLMYSYAEVRRRAGYSARSSSSNHRHSYWMHFVKEGSILMCTEEFALHLLHQKRIMNNRHTLKASQPVLPLGWGDNSSLLNQKGGSHASH